MAIILFIHLWEETNSAIIMKKNIEDAEVSSSMLSKGGTTNHIQNLTVGKLFVCNDYYGQQLDLPQAGSWHFQAGPQMPPTMQQDFSPDCITIDIIGQATKEVQKHFWGQSSYGYLYCVLRDVFHQVFGMKRFEEIIKELTPKLRFDFKCPFNTISDTFYSNKYMKMHIDKWSTQNVKKRVTTLIKAFTEAIYKLIKKL